MRKFTLKEITLTLCALLFCSQSYARIIHIDWSSTIPITMATFNNANSWATAIPDLQYAMYYANSGDEIWVMATPASNPYLPMGNIPAVQHPALPWQTRPNFFWIRNDVKVYGGFKGGETSLDDRLYWFINQTHLSTKQHAADYTLYMQGSESLLDGFFIDFYHTQLSGIVMESGTVYDNQIIANTIIKGDVFKYADPLSQFIKYGIINVGGNNTKPMDCGAVLYNVTIYDFTLTTSNGLPYEIGLINVDGGKLDIHNVTIADNTSQPKNGSYNGIQGLAVALQMGRVFGLLQNPYPAYVNIINSIIWYRPALGIYYSTDRAIRLDDFGNGAIKVSHSDIMNSGGSGSGYWNGSISDGGNNIDKDPLFLVDVIPTLPSRLSHIWYEIGKSSSPVVDAGNNRYPACLPYSDYYAKFDLKNEYRIVDNGIDMGAFEWQEWQYDHKAFPQMSPRRNDNQTNSVQIYPNPASETAILQLGDLTSGKVFVTDLQGRTLETFDITENNVVLNVTNYQSGIYLVRIISDKVNITERLIVSK